MRRAVLLLWVTGCDIVFSADRVPEPPPCVEVDHDEDGDGIDDGCDPCPFSIENDGDGDEDGIADACDPDLMVKNDVLAFTGFEPATRGAFMSIDGAFAADAFQTSGVGSQHMAWTVPLPEDGIWIITGVDVTKLESTEYREIGFVFDATPAPPPQGTQYNGTMCVLGRATTTDYVQILGRVRPNGDMEIATNANIPITIDKFSGELRGSYARTATPTTTCTVSNGTLEVSLGGTQSPAPPPGTVALYATGVDATFRFVFITTRSATES